MRFLGILLSNLILCAFTLFGAQAAPILRWEHDFQASHSAPVSVASDGTFYIADGAAGLNAFAPNGDLKWRYESPEQLSASSAPAVAEDGKIYMVTPLGLKAFSSDGTNQWDAPFDAGRSAQAIAPNGTILVGGYDGNFRSISSTGTVNWTVALAMEYDCTPAVLLHGDIVVAGARPNGALVWMLAPDGTIRWSAPIFLNESPVGGVALDDAGLIYLALNSGTPNIVSSDKGAVVSMNHDGSVKWRFNTERLAGSVVVGSTAIYAGTLKGEVIALNFDGQELWRFAGTNAIAGGPVIDSAGSVIFGTTAGKLI